jgi:predicted PurR-regulated permease PerM
MEWKNIVLILLGIVGILTLLTILPLLDVMIVSVLFGFILVPWRRRLDRVTRSKTVSSLIIVLILGIIAILLITYSTTIVINVVNQILSESVDVRVILQNMGLGNYYQYVAQMINSFVNWLVTSSNEIITQIGFGIVKLLVFFFVIYYVIKEDEKLIDIVKKSINKFGGPRKKKMVRFLRLFSQMVKSFFVEYILVSVIIGILAFIGFTIIDTPYAFLFAIITGILAFLPILASFMVFMPIGIWKLAINQWGAGIFIIAYGFIVLTIFPTFYLAPLLTSRKAKIHPILVLISLIAGPLAFGPMGFFYGPIILALAQSVYSYYIKGKLEEAA